MGKHDVVALGGTFDYFHVGHQILLLKALMVAKKEIIVGVTSTCMLTKKKNKESIQPLSIRISKVK